MSEEWETLAYDGFDGYDVSSYGRVQNNHTGRILILSPNQFGVLRVGLMNSFSHRQITLTVARMVADHFLPGKSDQFDTPINLDGDRRNNRVDNLMWRPRHFAVRYFHQFNEPIVWTSGIRCSSEIFENSRDAAMKKGLLEVDIMKSILNGEHTFPTWEQFERL